MINLFLTTYYLIDYFFLQIKYFLSKPEIQSGHMQRESILQTSPFCIKLELKLNRKKKLNPCFTLQAKFISNFD